MLNVFIGYGGKEAENVAKKLESFLAETKCIETFLASPKSQTLSPTSHNYNAKILENLIRCNIAIFVCHKETPYSKELKNELDILSKEKMEYKIILFCASDYCIPTKYRKLWHPLHFPSEKPEESFCRLLNQIYRYYIDIQAPSSIVKETTELIPQ
jgi:hypothetical protein